MTEIVERKMAYTVKAVALDTVRISASRASFSRVLVLKFGAHMRETEKELVAYSGGINRCPKAKNAKNTRPILCN